MSTVQAQKNDKSPIKVASADKIPPSTFHSCNEIHFPSLPDNVFRVKVTKDFNESLTIWIENKVTKRQWQNVFKSGQDLASHGIPFEVAIGYLLVIFNN